MSASWRASPRASHSLVRARIVALLILVPLAMSLLVRAALAELPAATSRLDPAAARRAGVSVELRTGSSLAPGLIEVQPLADAAGVQPSLLAVSPAGEAVALAERQGLDPTALILARDDGSQLRVELNGVLAATFAPDASWLALVDGVGSAWRLDAADGSLRPIADGPLVGPLTVEPSGTVLALSVSSVEAPIRSHLVRLDPSTGTAARLSDEDLVYGGHLLADGSIAVVAHRPDGTRVLRLDAGRETLLADLGPGAVNVSVARASTAIAFERAGEVFVMDGPEAAPRSVGSGENPRLAPDGASLVVDGSDGAALLDLDGTQLARINGLAAFAACGECRP